MRIIDCLFLTLETLFTAKGDMFLLALYSKTTSLGKGILAIDWTRWSKTWDCLLDLLETSLSSSGMVLIIIREFEDYGDLDQLSSVVS